MHGFNMLLYVGKTLIMTRIVAMKVREKGIASFDSIQS